MAFVLHHQLKYWLIVMIVLIKLMKFHLYIIFYLTLAFYGFLNVPLAPTYLISFQLDLKCLKTFAGR